MLRIDVKVEVEHWALLEWKTNSPYYIDPNNDQPRQITPEAILDLVKNCLKITIVKG